MTRFALVLAFLLVSPGFAQQAKVVTTCGSPTAQYTAGGAGYWTIDVNGNLCGVMTPTRSAPPPPPPSEENKP